MLTWSNMSSIKQGRHLFLISSVWTSRSSFTRDLSRCIFLVLCRCAVYILILKRWWCRHATSTSLLFTALQSLYLRAKPRQCTVIKLLPVWRDRLLDRVSASISATTHGVPRSATWKYVRCRIVAWRGSNRSWLRSLNSGSVSSLLRRLSIQACSGILICSNRDSWWKRSVLILVLWSSIALTADFSLLRLDALQESGEVWECYNYNAQIIHWLFFHCSYQHLINWFSTTVANMLKRTLCQMWRYLHTLSLPLRLVYHDAACVLSWYSVEYAVASDQDVVQIICNFGRKDVRVCYDTLWISTIFLHFSNTIAESTRNREATRHDTHRTDESWPSHVIGVYCVALIDFSTTSHDSFLLTRIGRFVISRYGCSGYAEISTRCKLRFI